MRPPSAVARGLAVAAIAATVASTVDVALAAFGARTANGGNTITAAPDFRAPEVTALAAGKAVGGATGFVKPGGGYYVYANVAADRGSPPSGIASVRADASSLTTGATALTLVAGSYSAGGISYGYRSAAQTANATLPDGLAPFTVTATDVASNANVASGSTTIDGTAPRATDVQTTNVGTSGLAELGDTLTLTYSEPIEPASVLAGWNGSATNVVVRLLDSSLLGLPLNTDGVDIYDAANSVALPLGHVDLGRSDYLGTGLSGNVRFGASGTPSRMALSGNTITVTLGTYGSTFLIDPGRTTAAAAGTMTWTPVATPYDRAQNVLAIAPAAESGDADKDF